MPGSILGQWRGRRPDRHRLRDFPVRPPGWRVAVTPCDIHGRATGAALRERVADQESATAQSQAIVGAIRTGTGPTIPGSHALQPAFGNGDVPARPSPFGDTRPRPLTAGSIRHPTDRVALLDAKGASGRQAAGRRPPPVEPSGPTPLIAGEPNRSAPCRPNRGWSWRAAVGCRPPLLSGRQGV